VVIDTICLLSGHHGAAAYTQGTQRMMARDGSYRSRPPPPKSFLAAPLFFTLLLLLI
jgi:hypothetical protein